MDAMQMPPFKTVVGYSPNLLINKHYHRLTVTSRLFYVEERYKKCGNLRQFGGLYAQVKPAMVAIYSMV
jgi:hypothetical protein